MPFPVNLPVLDDFERADANPIDGDWTDATAWYSAPGNALIDFAMANGDPAGGGFSSSFYDAAQYGPHTEQAFILGGTLTSPTDADYVALDLLMDDPETVTPNDGYSFAVERVAGAWHLTTYRVDASAFTALLSPAITLTSGDTFAVRIINGRIFGYQNGVIVSDVSDATYAGPFYPTYSFGDAAGATKGYMRVLEVSGATFPAYTRLYPTQASVEANVTGPLNGDWSSPLAYAQEQLQTNLLAGTKTNGGVQTSVQYNTNQQGDFDRWVSRFMTRPLAAQTISGDFDLCAYVQAVWVDPVLSPSADSVVHFRLSIYVTEGQTNTVRSVLSDFADSVDFPGPGLAAWQSLAAPVTMASQDCEDGDSVMVEFGIRVVSSPVPAPGYPPPIPPGQNYTSVPHAFLGTTNSSNVPLADATAGSTTLALAPWIDFTEALIELPPGAPPANDACADAVVIASLPYQSDRVNTVYSAGTQKEAWWTHTFTESGQVIVHSFGSNYLVQLDGGKGASCGAVSFQLPDERNERSSSISQSSAIWTVVAGEQWWFRERSLVPASNQLGARESGGSLQIHVCMFREPETDDVILPCGQIGVYREGELVALTAALYSLSPTGVAIDYTERPMIDQNGDVNTSWRLASGVFGSDIVILLDLPTLSVDESEVDTIADPLETEFSPGVPVVKHPSTLFIDTEGMLTIAFFGNGFQYVDGFGTSVPSILNTIPSDLSLYGGMRRIDATHGDSQAGAPFSAFVFTGTAEVTNPWHIWIVGTTIFYSSGGFYEPVGGTEIRRVSVGGGQLSNFATLTLGGGSNPGIKGLVALPDGGLVCNGTVVQRLNTAGAVISQYTPSVPEKSYVLVDVKVTSDGLFGWVSDLRTSTLFKFRISDMTEVLLVDTNQLPGTHTQLLMVQPVPPSPCPGRRSGEQTGA